jgi:hypothetical protein
MSNETPQAYPLSWPSYVPRTKHRTRAAFWSKTRPNSVGYRGTQYKTMTDALGSLQREMDNLLGASHMVLSTNVALRLDGLPRADQPKQMDPGAALYFNRNKQRLCMPCDKWDRVEDNIYAIAKHIEAMRGMERWGVGTTEQAFAGYKALSEGEKWWVVLKCDRDADTTEISKAFQLEAKYAHPDMPGGSHDAMSRLNAARDQAIAERKSMVPA